MRVLLVDVPGLLGQRLGAAVGRHHEVSIIDGDPRDHDTAARATSTVDTVVCGLPDLLAGHADPLVALDRAARGVYNLITTAAGANRFVLLSSLRPFERYPLFEAPDGERPSGWWAFHIVGGGQTRFPLGMAGALIASPRSICRRSATCPPTT